VQSAFEGVRMRDGASFGGRASRPKVGSATSLIRVASSGHSVELRVRVNTFQHRSALGECSSQCCTLL
jgi:hypothetical protein